MLNLKSSFAWHVILFILIAPGVHAQNAKSLDDMSSEQIWNAKKTRQAYLLGKEIELSLRVNEMAQLDCDATSDDAFSCVVFRGKTDVGNRFYDENGDVMTRGGNYIVGHDIKGSLRQVGELPLLAIMTWKLDGDVLKIHFRVESALDKIHRAQELATTREKGQWATQFSNSLLTPVVQLSETERLAGFINLWSEVKYNFVFIDKRPGLDWDKVLVEYLPKIQKAESTFEYYRLLRQCMALLHDGHSDVGGPDNDPTCTPPIAVAPIDGRAIIVAIKPADKIKNPLKKAQLLKANLKLGEEVTEVNGRPVQEILSHDLYPYISSSTIQFLEQKAFPRILAGENHAQAVLAIKDQASVSRKVTLTCGAYAFPRSSWTGGFQVKDLGDGILYVNLPGFANPEIDKQFEGELSRVRGARGIILDIRGNGGGSSDIGEAIISYLTDKPIKSGHWKTRQYMPAFKAWGQGGLLFEKDISPKGEKWHEEDNDPIKPKGGKPFLGPVVVLTGPKTFSAAEDFVVALQGSGRAKVVGEKTGGSTGQPLPISLPGGGAARVCTKWDAYADGREFVGVGVIPDVEIHLTWQDIAYGRDRVLEAGIASLKKALESKAVAKKPRQTSNQSDPVKFRNRLPK
jgi:C-terminal processing protease CtpA/Prc